MALFVKLRGVDNTDQFVNLERVTRMVHYASSGEPFTVISFDHENSISVREAPFHILGSLPPEHLLMRR